MILYDWQIGSKQYYQLFPMLDGSECFVGHRLYPGTRLPERTQTINIDIVGIWKEMMEQ